MKFQTTKVSAFIAVFLGIAQCYFLKLCWVYIGIYSPLVHWLSGFGLGGVEIRTAVFPVDFLTSIMISLPAAFVLLKLRPRKLWLYLLLAVVPSFVWLNWGLIGGASFTQFAGSFAMGWLPELFALPAAVWLLHLVSGRTSPRKSLKADGCATA